VQVAKGAGRVNVWAWKVMVKWKRACIKRLDGDDLAAAGNQVGEVDYTVVMEQAMGWLKTGEVK
jgi:hypothetical protein